VFGSVILCFSTSFISNRKVFIVQKEAVTLDLIKIGVENWNQSHETIENFNGMEFIINRGVIDMVVDHKIKHVCVSIGSTKMPNLIRLKEHE